MNAFVISIWHKIILKNRVISIQYSDPCAQYCWNTGNFCVDFGHTVHGLNCATYTEISSELRVIEKCISIFCPDLLLVSRVYWVLELKISQIFYLHKQHTVNIYTDAEFGFMFTWFTFQTYIMTDQLIQNHMSFQMWPVSTWNKQGDS